MILGIIFYINVIALSDKVSNNNTHALKGVKSSQTFQV